MLETCQFSAVILCGSLPDLLPSALKIGYLCPGECLHRFMFFLHFFVFMLAARMGWTDRQTGKTCNAADWDGRIITAQ